MTVAILETTTLYTFDDASPVVTQRQFTLGAQRPVPDLGAFQWTVDLETGGADECRMWTEGVITPQADADLAKLQSLVSHVVEQGKVDTRLDDDDSVPALRKKACA